MSEESRFVRWWRQNPDKAGEIKRRRRVAYADKARQADWERREPISGRLLSPLERLSWISVDPSSIERNLLEGFSRWHWHQENCPHPLSLEDYVRFALRRRGIVGRNKRFVARIIKKIREQAMRREQSNENPYWWRD